MKSLLVLTASVVVCVTSLAQAPAKDALAGAVDPYDPAAQRLAFIAACGVDNELSAEEFAADAKTGKGVAASFDRWEALTVFDRDRNKSIDWFELDAYRQAQRATVMAQFDADKNGKLTDKEREAALAALAKGLAVKPGAAPAAIVPPVVPPTPTVVPLTPTSTEPATAPADSPHLREGRDLLKRPGMAEYMKLRTVNTEEYLKQFDADKDGRLSDDERKAGAEAFDKKLRELQLAALDENKDGKLSMPEIQNGNKAELAVMHQRDLDQYDKNGNGHLDGDELKAKSEAMQKQVQETMHRFKLARYDANKNGTIDPDEQAAMDKVAADSAKRLAELQQQYHSKWDTDGDGKVSDQERAARIEKLKAQQEKLAAAMRKLADADGDGTLTLEESQKHYAKMLQKYDADGNGFLNGDEVTKLNREEYGVNPE